MSWLFAADSITKSFGRRTVLKSASIWGRPGTLTVLLGRNGCGKSTILKIGSGLLPADQGVVHFDGRAYLRPRLGELAARGLFYLPDSDLLSRRLSIRFQLEAVAWRFGSRDVEAVAEELGIVHILERTALEVSGGELRKAEVAAAVIRRPRCLLADEPLAGVNPQDREVIAAALRSLCGHGCAVILTGHDVADLLGLADEIVWMTAGTTHWLGSSAEASGHEQFRREYLGAVGPMDPGPSIRSDLLGSRSGPPRGGLGSPGR